MPTRSKLSIAAQFHQLDNQLSTAKCCFNLYQNIALDSSTISREELNKWSGSFNSLVQAEKVIISQTLFIQLHKFFDRSSDSIHLKTLIDECRDHPEYVNINQKYKTLLGEKKDVIKRLRNKVYASY